MNVLVLKTKLSSQREIENVRPLLDMHPQINRWNVDSDDIDNVLRIEASGHLKEEHVKTILRQYDIPCELMQDM